MRHSVDFIAPSGRPDGPIAPNRHRPVSRRIGLILMMAGMLMGLGCSRKEAQSPPVTPPPPAPPKQIEAILTPPAVDPTPPPPNQPAAPAEARSTASDATPSFEPGIAELNAALSVWVFKHNNPPKDLGELVKAGLLKKVPTPPAGKRYVVNPLTMSARLE
jgi:hypothetical protein